MTLDYIAYIADTNIANKFLHLGYTHNLSKFRLTKFGIYFNLDVRLSAAAFYGTRILIDQVFFQRFHTTTMHRYLLSSRIRFNQSVGATVSASGRAAVYATYIFLQYSLIRMAYGLVYLGPDNAKMLYHYLFRTGFNRVVFLFTIGLDAKPLVSLHESYFYGFDISLGFFTSNLYMNKVILSHYGFPLL